jgi:hypothetical protein
MTAFLPIESENSRMILPFPVDEQVPVEDAFSRG